MKDHIPKCRFIQWTVAPSATASTLASPQSVPTVSQPPSNSHHPTGTAKRKAIDMASSAPSSALPPAEVDTSTSQLRSVSPAASQTSVFQSLTTQLELYMKSTDSALINSQTALERSQIALQQSQVALQQITTSIAALEEKVDYFLTTTTAYRADITAKWENLTDQLALQATQQLAIQDAVGRAGVGSSLAIAKVLRDITLELAKKNDDAIARNNDVLGAISQQRADSQETTRRLDGMSLARVPLSYDFSGFVPSLTAENLQKQYNNIGAGLSPIYPVGENPPSKKVRFATSSRTSGNSSPNFSGSLLSTSVNTINLPDDDEHIQRNQAAMAARQNEEFYRATGTEAATDKGQEEDDDIEKDAGNNAIN
ncbi:hypothetical protein F5H01DRAFT_397104 [Linnemannia elongata]|nr:hypothetical protein F5H01DRAFT_397104 [Linnemannia elongata]